MTARRLTSGATHRQAGRAMATAVIVDAVRTAMAKRNGALAGLHPVDLAAETLRALVERNDLDPGGIDDVIMGCVCQTGEQALNVGRNAALAAGFPDTVPGTTIDRQCGSSEQALHFAAQGVIAGAYDVVIAAGVESMSRVPMGATVVNGPGKPFGPRMTQRYQPAGGLVPQGLAAEMIAERWNLAREELDAYSLESHRRAARAAADGRFDSEIVPVVVNTGTGKREFRADDGIRADASMEALARLQPSFTNGGRITAGNSCQISDGAAAVLVMSEERAGQLGLVPRARVVAFGVAGVDPVLMLTGAVPATTAALGRAELQLKDLDAVEVNEAFAAVVLAWADDLGADLAKVNVNGGAIALGHPLGASGARMTATLLGELERRRGRYGLQTMCEGGGMANATILERLG
ncbi:MAG TPA: thiolase family protein [Acidimicrobiales bacterium]|nr:thiolase family protein [Acidimicrobiales bacterium]